MDDPDQKAKIEQYAKEHNISIDEARQRYMQHKQQ